jgi:FAD/FMN-containing dehydrogenase
MGGQQFAHGATLIDTRSLDRVVAFDRARGLVTVEAGIQWPALLEFLDGAQREEAVARGRAPRLPSWGIYQKQTGADRLTIGGALACNAHGRGLTLKPIVDQVESFELVDARGTRRWCSRDRDGDLFRLAIGGYGLFGVMTRVTLRLRPRVKVRREVVVADTGDIMSRFDDRIAGGYLYGDFQFATDSDRDSFLRRGVFSCYAPVAGDVPLTANPTRFSPEDWARLTLYSHSHKAAAFAFYSARYLETSGQIYWADSQLSAAYVDDYHVDLDRALGAAVKGSEMITEVYVPRPRLTAFMEDARRLLRDRRANVIYGTVRLIERDDETVLAWARDRYACIVLNLHVDHTAAAIAAAAATFQALIDMAIAHGGSYYLTYHRWARPDQLARCYPRLGEFLGAKRRHDPGGIFQSEWFRAIRATAPARRAPGGEPDVVSRAASTRDVDPAR